MKITTIFPILLLLLLFPAGTIALADVAADLKPSQFRPELSAQTETATASGNQAIKNSRPQTAGLRQIRVGIYENAPKISRDKNGAATGIFPAILEEIARQEKWRLTYVPCQWAQCLEALLDGHIDLLPDVALSPERNNLFDFHNEEVVSSWSAVYSNNRDQINSIADLDGRRLAVLKGSIQHAFLEQMVRGFGFEVTFLEADSFEQAARLTGDNSADAVVANHFFGDYFYHHYGLKKTPLVFNPVSLYFATNQGAHPDLLKAIDDNLRAMKKEPGSIYYKALVRWMEQPPKVIVSPSLVWITGVVSALLVFALLFISLLRWQVKTGTRHLARANKMLSDSEKKFRDLFHQHAAVKLLIDPDSGKIVEANSAAINFYGWPREELCGRRLQDLDTMPGEWLDKEIDQVDTGHRPHSESRHRMADGSLRDVSIFSSSINSQGKTLVHAIIHDITERRLLEDQLRQAQKMEAVGRLAGGVAHDYNNMLTVIMGYTELALEKTDTGSPLHNHLQEVFRAANRSADITRQLLAFSRKQPINAKVLNINDIVTDMLTMLHRLIGEEIKLVWLPTAGIWPIRIDPTQLEQILVNLCVNAQDAINGIGRITLETANVSLDEAYCDDHLGFMPGDFVSMMVSDNGCGMDRQTLNHVFEPFFTTKTVGHGTGLGMATVYGIIKQNNGFINTYSEQGKGTTFKIYLPRHRGKLDRSDIVETTGIPLGHGETVLLVEDERSILQMSKKMLEKLGYHILAADSPKKAIRLAAEQAGAIDLLITDVIMPEMNGRELADHLRSRQPDLDILFMSGYTGSVIRDTGVLDDGMLFIQKPFSQRDLATKVASALSRSSNKDHREKR